MSWLLAISSRYWLKVIKTTSSLTECCRRYPQYTTVIEGITIHYLHQKSNAPNAIPLLLVHGWPGSFAEFMPIIDSLTTNTCNTSGKKNQSSVVAFDVVIPSLPGFAFSSAPPANWTLDDTARVFNSLMTDVLGYKTYAAHGTDFGAMLSYSLYDNFNTTVRAVHLLAVPFFPFGLEDIANRNITLTPYQKFREDYFLNFQATGNAYNLEHSTKVS